MEPCFPLLATVFAFSLLLMPGRGRRPRRARGRGGRGGRGTSTPYALRSGGGPPDVSDQPLPASMAELLRLVRGEVERVAVQTQAGSNGTVAVGGASDDQPPAMERATDAREQPTQGMCVHERVLGS